MSTGRPVTDNCFAIDSPSSVITGTPGGANLTIPTQDARPGFCHVSQPWSGGTAFGFNFIYPLPWDVQISSIYQNKPGFPIRASDVVSDAEVRQTLGRHLSTCPSQTAATCTQTATIDLIPNSSLSGISSVGTLYGERIKQFDLRFSRFFRLGDTSKVQANFDVYNVFNNNTVLNEQTRYSLQNNQWRNPIQIMGGRLVKFGAQYTF